MFIALFIFNPATWLQIKFHGQNQNTSVLMRAVTFSGGKPYIEESVSDSHNDHTGGGIQSSSNEQLW